VGTGKIEGESSTGRVWAAGFHHVTVRSRLAHVLKLMKRLFLYFSFFFSGRGKSRTLNQWIRGHECRKDEQKSQRLHKSTINSQSADQHYTATTDFNAQYAVTHIEVQFHLLRLARSACQCVGLAAPCIVTTLVQDRAVRDVCLAGVRVHILDLYQSWLRHPTLSFPANCDGVLHCFRQVCVCKQIMAS
jgi:hypothetical protein